MGLIAVPFSTAVFPALSLKFSENDKTDFSEKFSLTFRQIIFLIIPLSLLFFILRAQIVRIILGTGRFGWVDTRLTAACLGLFSLGIFAQGLVLLFSKTFYAVHNTKIPALISIIAVIFNIVLSFLFVGLLRFPNVFQETIVNFLKVGDIKGVEVIGLPLALSLAGIFQFFLLLFLLYKKLGGLGLKEIWQSCLKIILAGLLMAFFTYGTLQIISPLVDTQTFFGIFLQTISAGLVGMVIYLLATFIFRSPELNIIKSSILERFSRGA